MGVDDKFGIDKTGSVDETGDKDKTNVLGGGINAIVDSVGKPENGTEQGVSQKAKKMGNLLRQKGSVEEKKKAEEGRKLFSDLKKIMPQ